MDQSLLSATLQAEDVSGDGTPTIRSIISWSTHQTRLQVEYLRDLQPHLKRPYAKWERDGRLLECDWHRSPGMLGHEFVLLTFGFLYQDRPTDELRMRKLTCRLDRWADEPAQFNDPFRATTSSSFLGSSSRKRKVPGIHHTKISRVQPDSWTDGGKEKKATKMGHIKMTYDTSNITLFHAIAAAHGYKDKAPNYDAYTAKCWSFSRIIFVIIAEAAFTNGMSVQMREPHGGEMVPIDSTERLDELLTNMDAEDIDAEGFLSSPGALCGAAAGASAALYVAPGILAVAFAAASGTAFGGRIGGAVAGFAAAAVTLFGASHFGGAAGGLALRKVASRKSHKLLSEIRQYVDNLEKHLL